MCNYGCLPLNPSSSNCDLDCLVQCRIPGFPPKSIGEVSSSLMGSLAKGFLRKVHGKFAEICKRYVLLRQERVRKFCGKLRKSCRNLRKCFCNDPFPNDPMSELLKKEQVVFAVECLVYSRARDIFGTPALCPGRLHA